MTSRRLLAVGALGVLAGVEGLQSYGVSLFTPQLQSILGATAGSVLTARTPALGLLIVLSPILVALAVGRALPGRLWAARVGALLAAIALTLTGEVRGTWALVGVLSLAAVVTVPGRVLQRSIAVASYDEGRRVSALSLVQLGVLLAQLLLSLVIVIHSATSWHHALTVAGAISVVAVVVASAMSYPDEPNRSDLPASEAPSWSELSAAWTAAPSLIGTLVALVATGLLLMPYDAVLSIYLHQHFHLGLRGVSGVFLAMAALGVATVAATMKHGDALVTQRPADYARRSAVALALASVLLLVGPLLSSRTILAICVALGAGVANALVPALVALGMAVVPRDHRTALCGAAVSALAFGSVIGVVAAICVADRYGARYALVSLAGIGVLAAAWLRVAAAQVEADRRRSELQRSNARSEGAARPSGALLVCRDIDFSYGSLQVLFDVDAHVDDGEIVGLLGTNGAGKSTLLRVISGLGMPQNGSVTFAGKDITYLDAEARVRRGITQVPGGKAVFRSMNVVENLQTYGYTLGRDRKAIDEAIDRCFEAFPRLRERRSSAAAMLSGGEQQMVALSKALILRPKLLLIDELSLGLAPVIVERLLNMVRRINAEGTAVVIVEQSVTTALSLVDRAYFMEKGEVRFDGPAADLIDRHDLLRAVFLEGAAKGVLA